MHIETSVDEMVSSCACSYKDYVVTGRHTHAHKLTTITLHLLHARVTKLCGKYLSLPAKSFRANVTEAVVSCIYRDYMVSGNTHTRSNYYNPSAYVARVCFITKEEKYKVCSNNCLILCWEVMCSSDRNW